MGLASSHRLVLGLAVDGSIVGSSDAVSSLGRDSGKTHNGSSDSEEKIATPEEEKQDGDRGEHP